MRQAYLQIVVRVESARGERWHVRRGHPRRRRRPLAPVALGAARAGHSSRAKVPPLERLAVWLCGAHRTPPAPPHTCVARRWCPPISPHSHAPAAALSRAQWASASGTKTVRGPTGFQRRTDCPSWCEAQVVESCELRNALKSGYKRDSLVKIRWPRRRHMAPVRAHSQPLGASVRALERGPGKYTSSGPPCGAQSRGV